eukprot:scaffold97913_cov66-Phaeocystis_antarctica.AAC.5
MINEIGENFTRSRLGSRVTVAALGKKLPKYQYQFGNLAPKAQYWRSATWRMDALLPHKQSNAISAEKPCVQRAAVDERLLVGESRATTLVS